MFSIPKLLLTVALASLIALGARADDFSLAVSRAKLEAEVQADYFQALGENPEGSGDDLNLHVGNHVLLAQAIPIQMAVEAQQSEMFWRSLATGLGRLETLYGALPESGRAEGFKYRRSGAQLPLGYLLEQINRAAQIAFGDLYQRTRGHVELKYRGKKDPKNREWRAASFAFNTILNAANSRDFDANPWPYLKIDRPTLKKNYRIAFGETFTYRSYFTDFVTLMDIYDQLKKFMNPDWIPINFAAYPYPHCPFTWVDLTMLPLKISHQLHVASENELTQIVTSLIENLALVEATALERDRTEVGRYEAKRRKKARKKAAKAALVAAPEFSPGPISAASLEPQTPFVSLPAPVLTAQEVSPRDTAAEDSPEDSPYEPWDHEKWLDSEIRRSREKRTASLSSSPRLEPVDVKLALPEIHLSGIPAKVYEMAMGVRSHQVSNDDVKKFLRAIGGKLGKLHENGDPHFILPNYSPDATRSIFVGKMHMMHGGSETFPESWIRKHLGKMIRQAGLDLVIVVD